MFGHSCGHLGHLACTLIRVQAGSYFTRDDFMTTPKFNNSSDWTGLLSDPDLLRNLGKLLQIYREAPPELLEAVREIKQSPKTSGSAIEPAAGAPADHQPLPSPAFSVPPFEPDLFTPVSGEDRRRSIRMRCFVAVELRLNSSEAPAWGNLSNTSLGGCQVETSAQIGAGSNVEIGLWVANGKIWVKGLALNGVVSRSTPTKGVRIRFASMDNASKESLRQFLKYIQETTRASKSESAYLHLLK
jgi:hypothetical protein